MNEQPLENFGIWIPRYISEVPNNVISSAAKLVFGFIDGFTRNGKDCYASNETFNAWTGESVATISRGIQSLVDGGLVVATYDKDNIRHLKTTSLFTPIIKMIRPSPQNEETPLLKMRNNNIEDNNIKENKIAPSESGKLTQQPVALTRQQKNQRFYAHFWKMYPNHFNWMACFNRYNELVDSGEATVEEIEAGANRVVKWLAEGKIGGKQFVVSAPNFLADYRFRDTDPPRGNFTPTAAIVAREKQWDRQKAAYNNPSSGSAYAANLVKRPEDPHTYAQTKSRADAVYLRRLAAIGDGTDEDTKIIDGNKMWWVKPKQCSMTIVEAKGAWDLYWKSFANLEPPKMGTNYLEDFWNNRLTSCKNDDMLKASNT